MEVWNKQCLFQTYVSYTVLRKGGDERKERGREKGTRRGVKRSRREEREGGEVMERIMEGSRGEWREGREEREGGTDGGVEKKGEERDGTMEKGESYWKKKQKKTREDTSQ